jgi:hypothetical protein
MSFKKHDEFERVLDRIRKIDHVEPDGIAYQKSWKLHSWLMEQLKKCSDIEVPSESLLRMRVDSYVSMIGEGVDAYFCSSPLEYGGFIVFKKRSLVLMNEVLEEAGELVLELENLYQIELIMNH